MSEADAVRPETAPNTRASLAADFRTLGLVEGDLVLCHSSLSALGWCCGGAEALLAALLDVLGPGGTLVVPAHSSHLSEPSNWCNPPVPPAWWPVIRETMPAFDDHLTGTRAMGALPDCLLRHPARLRSSHPQVSFAALGPLAEEIVGRHALAQSLGDGSPLARVYDRNGRILLLGVGHDRNTSLHLAEARADWPGKAFKEEGAPVMRDGRRVWVRFRDQDWDEEDFPAAGAAFEAACPDAVRRGPIGRGEAILLEQRALVDFAATWFTTNRK